MFPEEIPVIAHEYENRILEQSLFLQRIDKASDALIDREHHLRAILNRLIGRP